MGQAEKAFDVSKEAAIRVLKTKGFPRLSDTEWKDFCRKFKAEGFSFDTFTHIAKKTLGYDAPAIFKAWNSIEIDEKSPTGKHLGDIIKLARRVDKEMFVSVKKILDSGDASESMPERKADKIAWLLRHHKITYNTLRDSMFVDGEMLDDVVFAQIHYEMMNHGVSSKQAIESVMLAMAGHCKFNPIEDYLNRVYQEYDGSSQIEKLCGFFEDEESLFPLYFRKWCIGSVARVFKRAQNPMLVLMGAKGAGKGFFTEWLCPIPELYVSQAILPDNKDYMLRACDRWIWEVVELGSTTRRADIEALRAFLTQKVFTVRRPYGHGDVDKFATASFIGTINDDGAGFLSDISGTRRYRPVTLTDIKWGYAQEIDIHQLWGQAMSLYMQGETAQLDSDDNTHLQTKILPKYKRVNILEDFITETFERDEQEVTPSTVILDTLYARGYHGKNSKSDMMDLSTARRERIV